MAYIITATNLIGAISLRRDAPAAALKKAIELTEQGMMNVRITDEQGRQYEPGRIRSIAYRGEVMPQPREPDPRPGAARTRVAQPRLRRSRHAGQSRPPDGNKALTSPQATLIASPPDARRRGSGTQILSDLHHRARIDEDRQQAVLQHLGRGRLGQDLVNAEPDRLVDAFARRARREHDDRQERLCKYARASARYA